MTRRILFFLSCVLLCAAAWGQQRLEIIPLQHRLPEQVLPTLQSLLEPGATLSTANNKLFLRASPANIEQIRRALAEIDTPLRRLMISVRQGGTSSGGGTDVDLSSGRIVIGPDGKVRASGDIRADSNTTQGSSNAEQRVQTVEGGEATIFLGRSLPLPMRQVVVGPGGAMVTTGTQYVDVGSGFRARPQLIGERVVLDISPQMQRIENGGTIQGNRMSTQVEGRLGTWIPLGGGSVERSDSRNGTTGFRSGQASQTGDVWLMVEVLP